VNARGAALLCGRQLSVDHDAGRANNAVLRADTGVSIGGLTAAAVTALAVGIAG
jgi:hypothetical protein